MELMAAKIIVLTGATRGLGRALTDGFIARGHTLLGCGRGTAQLEALRKQYATPHDFAKVDVRVASAVDAWAKRLLEKHGPPDLLVNNAAVINTVAPLWKITADEFERLMDINVNGVARVLRAFLPAMVARKKGVIVNFSSGWGRSASPEVAPYCASKYAIEGLTLALAKELPAGMCAVPLNPGVIDTDMLRSAWGESAGTYPSAEQWAVKVVPFLLAIGPPHNGKSLTAPF
ncbi:MAG: SDR family NAD(P)-dependent oxidoreductase [Planctomycetia bacterium]|nr:SDR family NAD(P)-dependent oxidoreductase [Planctomycetia bacterium]